MASFCMNCGKSTVYGRSQTHHRGVAGKRWKHRAHKTSRTFKPNIQKTTIVMGNTALQMNLCTKCIKKFRGKNVLLSQQVQLQATI